MTITTDQLYADARTDAGRLGKRLYLDAAIADERGAVDRARRLRSAAELVTRAAAVLDETKAARRRKDPR